MGIISGQGTSSGCGPFPSGEVEVLELIDESLEAFLRAAVPLSARDVDVSFEAPDRTWSAKLNRPTVNLFLWDIKRSKDHARTGLEEYEDNGVRMRRMALPRVELSFLVTAWTSEHADERALLGGLLRSVLAHSSIPEEYVAADLRALSPLSIGLSRGIDKKVDVFKTLEGQLKPALDVMVVTDVDTGLGRPTAPEVSDVSLGVSDREQPSRASGTRRVAGEVRIPDAAGRVVLSPRGSATIDPSGRFLIHAITGDELRIETDPVRTVVVPDQGGVVVT